MILEGSMFTEIIATIGVAAISAIAGFILKLVNKWVAANKDDKLINAAGDIIKDIVNATSQTVVSDLKKANKFDSQTAVKIKNDVIDTIQGRLNPEMVKSIQTKYDIDIKEYLTTKVEAVLAENKKSK